MTYRHAVTAPWETHTMSSYLTWYPSDQTTMFSADQHHYVSEHPVCMFIQIFLRLLGIETADLHFVYYQTNYINHMMLGILVVIVKQATLWWDIIITGWSLKDGWVDKVFAGWSLLFISYVYKWLCGSSIVEQWHGHCKGSNAWLSGCWAIYGQIPFWNIFA